MDVCTNCGLNVLLGVHAPHCPKVSQAEINEVLEASDSPYTAMVYAAILERTQNFLRSHLIASMRDTDIFMTDAEIISSVKDTMDSPVIKGAIISSAMITMQVLTEQDIVDINKLGRAIEEFNGWDGK